MQLCYLTSPHDDPSHLAEKAVLTVIVWPPPLEVICPEPFTASGLSASIFMVPLVLTSPTSHETFTSIRLPVELMTVSLHSCWLLKGCSASFSFVSQPFEVWVLVLGVELAFAFMRASILARCSGLSFARNSAGMGIWPDVVILVVLSHRPVFTFSGWNFPCAHAADEINIIPINIFFIMILRCWKMPALLLCKSQLTLFLLSEKSIRIGSVPAGPTTHTFTAYCDEVIPNRNLGGINERQELFAQFTAKP